MIWGASRRRSVAMTTAAAMNEKAVFDLLDVYRRRGASGFDEVLESGGAVRRHWQPVLDAVQGLAGPERELRAARLARRVRETGIAYDIFADPNTPAQRWTLDLLPVVISAAEWRQLERALIQRALLFDALLNDVYGEQDLLRQGLVPPELLFSDPAYLIPCNGILPKAGGLRFYAADLARGEDGRWRVIDNHTETLAGIGFALANRVAHTHVLGDLFKNCNARRLAGYFQELQTALTLHSGCENARVALMTPGPHHEDYFSHAYLARYLGYLLVEGHDLKTRNGQVYLRTLEGLKHIDLIVRCVEGGLSDPLELDPAGFKGPAGLLRVCRQTPGIVVNAIGTALAQNRGLAPYLPRLARHILGEDLALADAPRLWLGEAAVRKELFAQPERFTIRKAQEGTGRPGQASLGWDARALSAPERERMKREVELHGAMLVAEEKIGFSTAPVYGRDGLVPMPFAVRLYVSRTEAGYQVMPGGLAMSIDPGRAVALSAPDGQTRDVWVLGEGEQAPHISLWRPTLANARVDRSQRVIQSRVADDLFWLGRYGERADWTMRVLRGALRRVEEDSGPDTGRRAAQKCLEMFLGKEVSALTGTQEVPTDDAIERLSSRLIATGKDLRSLGRTLDSLYRVAHLVRDRLSLEAWQTLSKFRAGDTWRQALNSARPVEVLDILDEGLATLAAFNGFMHENMTRNHGWSFLDMGRRIERAHNLSEAILTLFIPLSSDSEEVSSSLRLLLELADSFITYRSRYRLDPMLPLVLDLLMLDESNPRSLAFQISAIARHLQSLPDSQHGSAPPEDQRLIVALLTSIRSADIEVMSREQKSTALEKLLMDQLEMLPELSNEISRHYFNVMDEAPHRAHTRVGSQP